jgi:hypothetical protein
MADGLSRVCDFAAHNYKVSDVNQTFSCSSCFKYKSDLEEMVEELITARKIIQLLQKDLNNYKDLTLPSTSDERSNSHTNSKRTNNWEIVTDKRRKSTRVIHDQLPIPVIPIANQYSFYLFSRLYNVFISSCAHLTIILSSSSSCLCIPVFFQ